MSRLATGPILVTGRPGPMFLLIPADPDNLAEQEREITQAMARANLRAWQAKAVAAGLDQLTESDIDAEIALVRAERRVARSKPRKPTGKKRS